MTSTAGDAANPLGGGVLIVGAGLIGASVGMALQRVGVSTYLRDIDTGVAHVASSRGAGAEGAPPEPPVLVVVATPPDHLADEIERALVEYPAAVVTDVCSVKGKPLDELTARGVDTTRYVGGHPMAGSERSGPLASAADLFEGRTWAIVASVESPANAVKTVELLAELCGATVVRLSADEHDLAVARISHLPHVVAAITAGQLRAAPAEHLALSGQGVRDVTRIAAGDPKLWRQIVAANSGALSQLLTGVRDDIDAMLASLGNGDAGGIERLLEAGAAGTAVIPGKHGGPSLELATVTVAIPDRPGALATLFGDAGDAGVNIEDLRIDHDPGRAYGQVEIDVAANQAAVLLDTLAERGWSAHR